MSEQPIRPIVFLPAMPLRSFWVLLPEDERDTWPDFQRKAAKGQIAFTYKQGREWWINLLGHAQQGLDSQTSETSDHAEEETDLSSSPPPEGDGKRDPQGGSLLRKGEGGRKGSDRDRPVRHRR